MLCPAVDCGFVDYFLECDPEDRYVAYYVMQGVECPGCQDCHSYDYYRTLVNTTITDMQRMFEKTVIMQNYLNENQRILTSINELHQSVNMASTFKSLLHSNADSLYMYLSLDPTPVLQTLLVMADQLDMLLSGASGESMSAILNDYTQSHVVTNEQTMQVLNENLSYDELMPLTQQSLHDLGENHNMIQNAIRSLEPPLLTLLQLPADSYDTMTSSDKVTLRVAFRLLEKSRDGVKSLLGINMDQTASALQYIITEAYDRLNDVWEAHGDDGGVTVTTSQPDSQSDKGSSSVSSGENTLNKESGDDGGAVDGSGGVDDDESSGDDDVSVVLLGEPPERQENNLFFQWLSAKTYTKLDN